MQQQQQRPPHIGRNFSEVCSRKCSVNYSFYYVCVSVWGWHIKIQWTERSWMFNILYQHSNGNSNSNNHTQYTFSFHEAKRVMKSAVKQSNFYSYYSHVFASYIHEIIKSVSKFWWRIFCPTIFPHRLTFRLEVAF